MIGPVPASGRKWLLGTVLSGMVVIAGLVAQYWLLTQLLTDDITAGLILGFTVLLMVRFGSVVLHRITGAKTAARIKQEYRQQLLGKLERLEPAELTPERRGKLTWLLGEGVEILDLYWGLFVPQFFIGLLGPLMVCGLIALIDPFIGGILALLIPLIPMILMLVFRRFASVSGMYKENLASLTEMFIQSLHGLPVLKLYRYSVIWGKQVEQQGEKLRKATMGLLVTNQLVIFLVDLLFSLGTIVVASVIALLRYQEGGINLAETGFIILASIELIRPLSLMGAFFFAGALGREVQSDIKATMALPDRSVPQVEPLAESELSIENLSFGYTIGLPLFREFSLQAKKGELVVITGPSGGGKSTLFKLISGKLLPDAGRITLRSNKLGYVQQYPYLFNLSLEDNIRQVRPDISPDHCGEIFSRLGLAQLTEHRYGKQEIGEKGHTLSGGQGTRVGLARAFVSELDLYLIDEPTRELDKASEQEIITALIQLKQTAAVVIISHADAVIQAADKVVRLQTEPDSVPLSAPEAACY